MASKDKQFKTDPKQKTVSLGELGFNFLLTTKSRGDGSSVYSLIRKTGEAGIDLAIHRLVVLRVIHYTTTAPETNQTILNVNTASIIELTFQERS